MSACWPCRIQPLSGALRHNNAIRVLLREIESATRGSVVETRVSQLRLGVSGNGVSLRADVCCSIGGATENTRPDIARLDNAAPNSRGGHRGT